MEGGEGTVRVSATPEGLYEEVASLTLRAKQALPLVANPEGQPDPVSPELTPRLDLNPPLPPAQANPVATAGQPDRIDIVSSQGEPPPDEQETDAVPAAVTEIDCETTTPASDLPAENEASPPLIMGLGLLGTLDTPAPERGGEAAPENEQNSIDPRSRQGRAAGRPVARTVPAPLTVAPTPTADPAAVVVTPESAEQKPVPAQTAQAEKAVSPAPVPPKADPLPEAPAAQAKGQPEAAAHPAKPSPATPEKPLAEAPRSTTIPQQSTVKPATARPVAPPAQAAVTPPAKAVVPEPTKPGAPVSAEAAAPRGETVRTPDAQPKLQSQPVAPSRSEVPLQPAAETPAAQEQSAPAAPRSAEPIARAPQPPQPASSQSSPDPVAGLDRAANRKVRIPAAQPFRVLRQAEATESETTRVIRREVPVQAFAAEPKTGANAKPTILREAVTRPAPSTSQEPRIQPAGPRPSAPVAEVVRTDPPREAATLKLESAAPAKAPVPAQAVPNSEVEVGRPAVERNPAAPARPTAKSIAPERASDPVRMPLSKPGEGDARQVVSESRLASFTTETTPVANRASTQEAPVDPPKDALPRDLSRRPVLERNAQAAQRIRPMGPAPSAQTAAPQQPAPPSRPAAQPVSAARPPQAEAPVPVSRDLPAGRELASPLRQLVDSAHAAQPPRKDGAHLENKLSSEPRVPRVGPRPVPAAPVRETAPAPRDLRPVRETAPAPRDLRTVRETAPAPRDLRPVRETAPAPRDLRPVRETAPATGDLRPLREAPTVSRDVQPAGDAERPSKDTRVVIEPKQAAAPEPPEQIAPVARREVQAPGRAWWLRTTNETGRETEAQGAVNPSPERGEAPELPRQDLSTPADPVRPRGERGRGDHGLPRGEAAARPGNEGSEGVSLWRPDNELTDEFPSRPSPQAAPARAAQAPAHVARPDGVTPPPLNRVDSVVEVRAATETVQALSPRAAHVAAQAAYHLRVASRGGTRETTITLDPPGLGRMRISLKEDGPQLTARLIAELPEVEGLLREGAEMIRERLNRQGLAIDRIVVESAAGRSAAPAQVTDQANWTSSLPSFDGLDADARRTGQQTSGREDNDRSDRAPRERGAAQDDTESRGRRPANPLALDVTA